MRCIWLLLTLAFLVGASQEAEWLGTTDVELSGNMSSSSESMSAEVFASEEEDEGEGEVLLVMTSASSSPSSPPPSTTLSSSEAQTTTTVPPSSKWPWMVFVLTGNSTVAGRRQRDLGTYLRLNLAARLDADYNDVFINRIVVTAHNVLANLSVEPSHLSQGGTGAAGMESLAQGNVTLLELSGHEFQVERIIRGDDESANQRTNMLELSSLLTGSSSSSSSFSSSPSSEVSVYGAVGAVFLFLMVALLLGLSFSNPCRSSLASHHEHLSAAAESNLSRRRRNDQVEEGTEMKTITSSSPSSNSTPGWSSSSAPPVIYTEQLARHQSSGGLVSLPSARFIPTAGHHQHHQPDHPFVLAELHHQS